MDLWRERLSGAFVGAGALIVLEGVIWFLFFRS
jgi:hypothetical protein